MTDSKHVLGTIFSSHSRDHCFHSTTKREANLTFNVLTPDNKKTIIQISNLIFLLRQTLYPLPEISFVFKCLLGEIPINKYVGPFQLPSKHSPWWRRLQKMSSRRLDQHQYIRPGHMSSGLLQDVLLRSFQGIFKTSSRGLAKMLSRYLLDVCKTFRIRLQDVFKTSSKCLEDVLQKHFQVIFKTSCKDVFKTFLQTCHQVKLFLFLFKTYSTHCKDGYLQKDLSRSHSWEMYGQSTKLARVIKISQVLVFHFTTPLRL